MDTVTNRTQYFNEINILRAIAILAVISIHVSADFTRMSTINLLTTTYMAIDVFLSLRRPPLHSHLRLCPVQQIF